MSDLRYGQWVLNAFKHPKQQLLKILEGDNLVAFFIVEIKEGGAVYWHLAAVSSIYHGKGYGRRVWLTMLQYHCKLGHSSISTTISANNILIRNLYLRLNFSFTSPEMTFHWVKK